MNRPSLLVLLTLLTACNCLPGGPPLEPQNNFDYVCNALRPNPASAHGPGSNTSEYRLEIAPPMTQIPNGFIYENNTTYTVHIFGGMIQGFLVQARLPGDAPQLGVNGMLLGSFQPGGPDQQTYNCDMMAGAATKGTITHMTRQEATTVEFTWTSPNNASNTSGEVDFYYTVVQNTTIHFDALSASQVGVMFATLPPPTTPGPTTTSTPMTTLPPTQPLITPPAGNIVAPVRAPEEYRIRVMSPDGCLRTDCDLFIGIDTNTGDDDFLDIYMEGSAAGWLAVGFSETSNMFLADVVACNRLGDSIVAIDSWNPGSPSRASNTDTIQDVNLYNASFDANANRLNCTVSKRITPSGTGEDLDLNNQLFVVFARRVSPSQRLDNLDTHAVDGTGVRGSSADQFAIASAVGVGGGNVFDTVHRPNLIRAHGILMIIAWPLLAITAIFFALFMRPALPNGEWFQVHRALLLSSLIIGLAAFILIFVALMNSGGLVDVTNSVSLTHFILGVIIMTLQIINPIIAIFRCHPGTKNRWIFNLMHGSLIGLLAEILALINVAIGLYIFSANLSQLQLRTTLAPFWVFVSWDVFYVLLVFILFGLFIFIAVFKKNKGLAPSAVQAILPAGESKIKAEPAGISLDSAVADKPQTEKSAPERKPPSKDAPLRWSALAVYLAITVPILLAIIVMVALPQ